MTEVERLRRREERLVEQLQDEVERVTRRAEAAEAIVRRLESLYAGFDGCDYPCIEVADLRAILNGTEMWWVS